MEEGKLIRQDGKYEIDLSEQVILQRGLFRSAEETNRMTEMFKSRLSGCVDKCEDGKLKMTIALPDESVLDNLAKSLARMAGS